MRLIGVFGGLLLLVLCIATISHAQPQQESAGHRKSSKSQQLGSERNPLSVKIAPSPEADARAKEEKDDREAKRKSDDDLVKFTAQLADYTKDLARYTGVLIGVGVIQVLIFIAQLVFIWRQETATKTIARAYVQVSHLPPGMKRGKNESIPAEIHMQIKNFGQTPAMATASRVSVVWSTSLSEHPDYGKAKSERSHNAFLVKGGEIFFHAGIPAPVPDGKEFCVFGYVDYIDAFKQRHRAGYARRYDPRFDDRSIYPSDDAFDKRNNLVFVGGAKYNYDRKRKKGEGDDWGKEFKS